MLITISFLLSFQEFKSQKLRKKNQQILEIGTSKRIKLFLEK